MPILSGDSCLQCVRPCTGLPPSTAGRGIEAFGRIFNQAVSTVLLSTAPTPLSLEQAGPLRNVSFTPGSMQILIPGAYEITYSITFGINDFERLATATVPAAANVSVPYSAALSAVSPLVDADVIAAVLLNGVELPASLAYASNVCCYSFSMHGSTIAALPANTVVSLAAMAGCSYCYGNQLLLIPNSQLYLNRIGDIA